jgi:hypothetical protein
MMRTRLWQRLLQDRSCPIHLTVIEKLVDHLAWNDDRMYLKKMG